MGAVRRISGNAALARSLHTGLMAFFFFFHEWENQEQEYVQQTDMSETAVWVEMKGLVILKAVSAA